VRIMATGRSDYPNQINNVLCFPGIFRGALDAGAPRITEEMKLGWEGCLSVPGLMGAVSRFTKIRYSGLAPDGSRIERVAEDFHARVVQHECDHLDGILYPQRMTDLSLLVFQEELRHGLPEAMREPTDEESEPV